jgi:glyoxylase-like metal-dependent hydrolase (beta-lactamase superfamily II)
VLHYERAVTPGDAFVYMPNEKILLIGDLIVNPITFALSGYATEWLRTLERIDRLDFAMMVTGHGPPLRDLIVEVTGDDPITQQRVQGAARGLVSAPRLRRARRSVE